MVSEQQQHTVPQISSSSSPRFVAAGVVNNGPYKTPGECSQAKILSGLVTSTPGAPGDSGVVAKPAGPVAEADGTS